LARIPAKVSALLRELAERLPVVLGRNLVGVYLYGSLTQRAFDPRRSDVDCVVVTRRDLSDAQFKRLGEWLKRAAESNHWAARLQMLFLVRDEVLTTDARACHYQFGVLKRGGSDGNPIIWMNVLESGVVLFGPRPESFVPAITPGILFEALVREVGYLREEISEKPSSEWRDVPSYRAYAVLTLCRILYSFEKGAIVSKRRAARWALRHLPGEWHGLILQASRGDDGDGRASEIPLRGIGRFIEFADARLRPTRAESKDDARCHPTADAPPDARRVTRT
jgi:predicted nucleotidyltransferase